MFSLGRALLLLVGTALMVAHEPVSLADAFELISDPPALTEPVWAPERPVEVVGLPQRLRIPSIHVDTEFEYVGLTPDGSMDAPRDPDKVGWYALGPRPGQPGNAAIAGHVDWAGKVRDFWWLRNLAAGDTVEVLTEDGQSYRFVVQWLRWYPAQGASMEEVFGSSDVPEITLITCGGAFDRRTHQYLSRLVVRASLSHPS